MQWKRQQGHRKESSWPQRLPWCSHTLTIPSIHWAGATDFTTKWHGRGSVAQAMKPCGQQAQFPSRAPPGKGESANWDGSESCLERSGACFGIVSPVPGPGYWTLQHLCYFQVLPWMWRGHCDLSISPRPGTLLLQELCSYRIRLNDTPGRTGHWGCLCLCWKPEMKSAVLVAKKAEGWRRKSEEKKQRKHQNVSKSWQWLSKWVALHSWLWGPLRWPCVPVLQIFDSSTLLQETNWSNGRGGNG